MEAIIIWTVLLLAFYFFIDRLRWNRRGYLWCVIVILVVVVLYQTWTKVEGFKTDIDIVDSANRKMFAFQYVPQNWFDKIIVDGKALSASEWTVIMVGWRAPCSHYADGYSARTYIRDGVWWFECHGHGSCWMHRVSFLAIPRQMVQTRDWYQGF